MAFEKFTNQQILEQSKRFKTLINYIKIMGYAKDQKEISRRLSISESHFSSSLTGKHTPVYLANKICNHYKLPFADWVKNGLGKAPATMMDGGSMYLGFLDERESLSEKENTPQLSLVLPENLNCDIVFIYRGVMYFVLKQDISEQFIDPTSSYFLETNDDRKYIGRIVERYTKDTRMLKLTDCDNNELSFDVPIDRFKKIYRIIATLRFNQ